MPINLRIPGPTPVPADVLQAGARQMVNHRGPEFKDLLNRVNLRLKTVFQTSNDVLMLTTSGTGGLEAAIVNTLSPGDKVLAVTVGSFGDRFADVAQAYGAEVVRQAYPWGAAADPDKVRKALDADPAIKAVAVTHNETSTGVTNDLEAIARVVRERERLLLLDAVSSLGCLPLPVDAWGCDVVVGASQKGFMVPPGLAFVSVSPHAWEASQKARMPRFYFDLARHKKNFEKGETPWTPAVSVFFALDLALDKMLSEGMENIFKRHARLGELTRRQVKTMGLSLVCQDERRASNAVTAVHLPPGVEDRALRTLLRTEEGVVIAGGQGPLAGKIFRIGHMGFVSEQNILQATQALKRVLDKLGAPLATGRTSAQP
ncbi:MAG: alanine--glyoxylate aminotransferase family protein [Dehalococcoidia bacterium]|nr:alanine--glyoxylate aminotransferase family protein [Dehalococcoidia bacterium]